MSTDFASQMLDAPLIKWRAFRDTISGLKWRRCPRLMAWHETALCANVNNGHAMTARGGYYYSIAWQITRQDACFTTYAQSAADTAPILALPRMRRDGANDVAITDVDEFTDYRYGL